MSKDAMKALKIQKDQADAILQAGRQEDAQNFLDTWRLNNLGTKDSGALPPVDAVPPHLRGIIFKRAAIEGMKIAGDLGPGDMWGPTEGGFFLTDEDGIHGHVYQNEGGYLKEGNMYDEGIHGLPVPRVQLKIRGDQKVAKTPSQQNATNMRDMIKKLTKEGKHIEAQALYREQFPRA